MVQCNDFSIYAFNKINAVILRILYVCAVVEVKRLSYHSSMYNMYVCMYLALNKNTVGVEKCEANQKQHCK